MRRMEGHISRRPSSKRHTVWTPDKWEMAQRMRAEGHQNTAIADALDLTVTQVQSKFSYQHSERSHAQLSVGPELKAALDQDRAARSAAADRRTLTQVFFGDPPIGFSALDQKQKNGTNPP